MPYVSRDLVHFVGARDPADDSANWATLERILAQGELLAGGEHGAGEAVLRRNLGDRFSENRRYLPAVTCFADIPLVDLALHTAKYGRFGLALEREFLVSAGARPVMYVPRGAATGPMGQEQEIDVEWDAVAPLATDAIVEMFGGRTAASEAHEQRRIEEFLEFGLLAFIKFFDPSLPDEDPDNFYMEREWRCVGGIDFSLSDVRHVFVAAGWADRLTARFPMLRNRVLEL